MMSFLCIFYPSCVYDVFFYPCCAFLLCLVYMFMPGLFDVIVYVSFIQRVSIFVETNLAKKTERERESGRKLFQVGKPGCRLFQE